MRYSDSEYSHHPRAHTARAPRHHHRARHSFGTVFAEGNTHAKAERRETLLHGYCLHPVPFCTEIGLFYATEAVKGKVLIDFTSFSAVPMYRNGTTFTNGEVIGGATGILLGANAVPMTSLSGKALHFEFKFETDGSFNICLLASDWANVTRICITRKRV